MQTQHRPASDDIDFITNMRLGLIYIFPSLVKLNSLNVSRCCTAGGRFLVSFAAFDALGANNSGQKGEFGDLDWAK